MNSHHVSETIGTTLLGQLKHGDNAAREQIVALYTPTLTGRLRNLDVSSSDVEDLVSDIFVRVFASVATFERDGKGHSFRRWLFTLARHVAYDLFRRRKHVYVGIPDDIEIENEAKMTEQNAARRAELLAESQRMIELVRHEFEPRTIACCERFYFLREDTKETATALQMSSGAVRDARYRVLKRLRELFFELYGDVDWPF